MKRSLGSDFRSNLLKVFAIFPHFQPNQKRYISTVWTCRLRARVPSDRIWQVPGDPLLSFGDPIDAHVFGEHWQTVRNRHAPQLQPRTVLPVQTKKGQNAAGL